MRRIIFTTIAFMLIVSINNGQNLIKQLDWLEGNWTTEKWGGEIDEYWSAPKGNNIIGSFRFVKEGNLNFTEHFIIIQENDKLTLKLKHFDPNFHGWEEKDDYVEFPFIEMKKHFVKFDGISYELIDTDSMKVLVNLEDNDSGEPEVFNYRRVK